MDDYREIEEANRKIRKLQLLVKDLRRDAHRLERALQFYHGEHFVREVECAMCRFSCKGHHGGQLQCPDFRHKEEV
jgi:hypothetical protein